MAEEDTTNELSLEELDELDVPSSAEKKQSRAEYREKLFWDWFHAGGDCVKVAIKHNCSQANIYKYKDRYAWEERRKLEVTKLRAAQTGVELKGQIFDRTSCLKVVTEAIKQCQRDLSCGDDKIARAARRELPPLTKSWKELQKESDNTVSLDGLSLVYLRAFMAAAVPQIINDDCTGFCTFKLDALDIPKIIRDIQDDPSRFCNVFEEVEGAEEFNEEEQFGILADSLAKVPRRPKMSKGAEAANAEYRHPNRICERNPIA